MQACDSDIEKRIEWLKATFRSEQLSQEAVAEATGIHQSQISRILSGQVRRLSKNVILLCKFADDLHNRRKSPKKIPPLLLSALEQIWDGSTDHAEAIAKVILSLKGMSVNHAN
jgi:transcriptional regulator with XRE-family HTH domain